MILTTLSADVKATRNNKTDSTVHQSVGHRQLDGDYVTARSTRHGQDDVPNGRILARMNWASGEKESVSRGGFELELAKTRNIGQVGEVVWYCRSAGGGERSSISASIIDSKNLYLLLKF